MKHTIQKRMFSLLMVTLLLCSFGLQSFASAITQEITTKKNLIGPLDTDQDTFQIETSIQINDISNEPVYIAVVLDSTASMNNKQDIWDSQEQQWVSRSYAASKAIETIIDQSPNGTSLGIYTYHQTAERLSDGFQPIHSIDGTRNPIFSQSSDEWILNKYNTGKNNSTDLSQGLQLVYHDMNQLPKQSKRYVVIINDSNDIQQGISQTYATALKSSQNTQIPTVGYGQNAEIWSILIGHDQNVNIGQWNTDWQIDSVDTGSDDGFPDAQWTAWTDQNPNVLTSNGSPSMTELHMITLATSLDSSKEVAYPQASTLYNWWSFYREQQQETRLENGKNVHYFYTMSLYDDSGVELEEDNYIPSCMTSRYTIGLTSLTQNINQLTNSIHSLSAVSLQGIETFDSSLVNIKDESAILFFKNNTPLPSNEVQYTLQGNQLSWSISNAQPNSSYSIRYPLTAINGASTVSNVTMGTGSYVQLDAQTEKILNNVQFPQHIISAPSPTIAPNLTPVPTSTPTATPTVTPAPTSNPTTTPTVTPAPTSNPTTTPTVTPAPTSSSTASPTVTPAPTSSPTASPTITPIPTSTINHPTYTSIPQPIASPATGNVFSPVETAPANTTVVNPPMNAAPTVLQSTPVQPTAASSTTATSAVATKPEKIDSVETKQLKGKSLQVVTTRTAILTSPKEKSKASAYIKQGKEFKIVGATENYLVIQYKKKDGIIRKGYIAKDDVTIIHKKK